MRMLVVHKRRVRLPAHGFTAHKLQRIFLTRRHATRLAIPIRYAGDDEIASRPLPPFESAWHEARRTALLCAAVLAVVVMAWHWLAM